MKVLQIRPLDPIFVRDGRPFERDPGIRAHSLQEVPPSVVAGMIRTLLRKLGAERAEVDLFNKEKMKKLARVLVRGPLLEWDGELYYPIPSDVMFYEEEGHGEATTKGQQVHVECLRPRKLPANQGYFGTGREGQHEDLWPPIQASKDKQKPRKAVKDRPAYMSATWMESWLCGNLEAKDWCEAWQQWQQFKRGHGYRTGNTERIPLMSPLVRDERTHTAIDPETYQAKDQQLFTIHSLVFPEGVRLLAAVEMDDSGLRAWPSGFPAVHPLGGERRLAFVQEVETRPQQWTCPEAIVQAVDGAEYIRMVLATPAYFTKGWRPGWLDENLMTKTTFSADVQLQLVWACVSRWQPISGWKVVKGAGGEKAVRRMAPAGSVYFFKVVKGNPRSLVEQKWLISVSDENRRKDSFDHEDGFGLALWGTWQPQP